MAEHSARIEVRREKCDAVSDQPASALRRCDAAQSERTRAPSAARPASSVSDVDNGGEDCAHASAHGSVCGRVLPMPSWSKRVREREAAAGTSGPSQSHDAASMPLDASADIVGPSQSHDGVNASRRVGHLHAQRDLVRF